MKVFVKVNEVKEYINNEKKSGKRIGLVPTMGYLHEGHLSLIKKSKSENDITVVSIFVNPTQFAPNEDFDAYPRDLERDSKLAESAGADIIFHPTPEEMYPNGYQTYVDVQNITNVLCGTSRPTHFRGVTTVVMKLFQIIKPDNAYFGQKDAQQCAVIKRMIADMNLDVNFVRCPIVREESGLALSSRNIYLKAEERVQALALSKSLKLAKKLVESGEKNAIIVKEAIANELKISAPLGQVHYIEIVDSDSLEQVDTINKNTLIALAVKFPSARLIDNIII